MHYVGSRNPRSFASPLRSLPVYRTVESVFGPPRQVKVEAELRLARIDLACEQRAFDAARAALGTANRQPVTWTNGSAGCRRYHQGEAMRMLNGRRRFLRTAQRRVAAALAAVASLTPVDAFATPYLAQLAGVGPTQVSA